MEPFGKVQSDDFYQFERVFFFVLCVVVAATAAAVVDVVVNEMQLLCVPPTSEFPQRNCVIVSQKPKQQHIRKH